MNVDCKARLIVTDITVGTRILQEAQSLIVECLFTFASYIENVHIELWQEIEVQWRSQRLFPILLERNLKRRRTNYSKGFLRFFVEGVLLRLGSLCLTLSLSLL